MEYHSFPWNCSSGPSKLKNNMAIWKNANSVRSPDYEPKIDFYVGPLNNKQTLGQLFSQMSVQPPSNVPSGQKHWRMYRSASAPISFGTQAPARPKNLPIFGCQPAPPPPFFVQGGFVGSKSQEKTSNPFEVFITNLIAWNKEILQASGGSNRTSAQNSVVPPTPPTPNGNKNTPSEKQMSYRDVVKLSTTGLNDVTPNLESVSVGTIEICPEVISEPVLVEKPTAQASTPVKLTLELPTPGTTPRKATEVFRDSRTNSECSSDGSWASFDCPTAGSGADLCDNPFLKQILGNDLTDDESSEEGEDEDVDKESKPTSKVLNNSFSSSSGTEDTLEDDEDEMECLGEGFVDTRKWHGREERGVALSPILLPKDAFASPEGFKGLWETPPPQSRGVVCFAIDFDSSDSEAEEDEDYDFLDDEGEEEDEGQGIDPECAAMEERVRQANERWEKGLNCDEDDVDSAHQRAETKVAFAPEENLMEIFVLLDLDLAYQAARKGEWETYALDRQHFRSRINSLAPVLEPILHPDHRRKVYQRLTQESPLETSTEFNNQCNQNPS